MIPRQPASLNSTQSNLTDPIVAQIRRSVVRLAELHQRLAFAQSVHAAVEQEFHFLQAQRE